MCRDTIFSLKNAGGSWWKIVLAILFGLISSAEAEVRPYLSISKDSPVSVQVSWTNDLGTSYRIFSTSDLTLPFSLWTPWADAFSDDVMVSTRLPATDSPNAFIAIVIPANDTLSAVRIFSPTNNQTVSGETLIRVGAQITNQLQGVNLYLDGALIGYLNSGGMTFSLDTTHFTNGLHALYVGGVDTVIGAKKLAAQFGNLFFYALPAGWGQFTGRPALVTHKPFNFVFLDGCNTAIGDLPEAFGISKTISGASLNDAGLHRRIFMGWSAPVVFQFDSAHIDWTLRFWTVWIDSGDADKTFIQAKVAADAYRPSVVNSVPIKWYGNASLKWSN